MIQTLEDHRVSLEAKSAEILVAWINQRDALSEALHTSYTLMEESDMHFAIGLLEAGQELLERETAKTYDAYFTSNAYVNIGYSELYDAFREDRDTCVADIAKVMRVLTDTGDEHAFACLILMNGLHRLQFRHMETDELESQFRLETN